MQPVAKPEWNLSLDPSVSLSQELNLSSDPSGLCGRAESGGLSAVRRSPGEGLRPEEALAAAVVLQAAADWRRAHAVLLRCPDHPAAASVLRETERFFRSRWFHTLVDLDGEAFLQRLKGSPEAQIRICPESPDPAALRRLRNVSRSMLRKRRRARNTLSRSRSPGPEASPDDSEKREQKRSASDEAPRIAE